MLLRLGRYDDAVRAFRNSLTYNGENAARHADLGEAMAAAAGGVITAEAKSEFERALALDAERRQGELFPWACGRAGRSQRRRCRDLARMLDKAPADAPWRPLVQAALVRVGAPSAPRRCPEDTMAAAKDMKVADREAMIRGMVERLATRLKQNGDDVDGWLRLVRAYMVMGDRDKAQGRASPMRGRRSPAMPNGSSN